MVSITYLIHRIQIRRRVGRACTVAVGDAIEDGHRVEVGLYSRFLWLLFLVVYLIHIGLVWLGRRRRKGVEVRRMEGTDRMMILTSTMCCADMCCALRRKSVGAER